MKIPSRANCKESQQSLKKKKKRSWGVGLFEEKQTGQHKATQAGEPEHKDTLGPPRNPGCRPVGKELCVGEDPILAENTKKRPCWLFPRLNSLQVTLRYDVMSPPGHYRLPLLVK